MAAKGLQGFSKSLSSMKIYAGLKDTLAVCMGPQLLRQSRLFQQSLTPVLTRSMATEAALPPKQKPYDHSLDHDGHAATESPFQPTRVLTTIYKFPTMEPLRFESYPSKHLHLPLRRDLLHRAVIFEGDAARQGTASSKTRFTVHGSHRKIRPQKGTGQARLGTKQSPMLRGGGKSFGPHPRDFSTELPRKMYDLAWRTALSFRYRKGELIICEDGMDIEYPAELPYAGKRGPWLRSMFDHNGWGKAAGRSLLIAKEYKDTLFDGMEQIGVEGRVLLAKDVDVKDLLELKRVIIEKSALDQILREHQSDLIPKIKAV